MSEYTKEDLAGKIDWEGGLSMYLLDYVDVESLKEDYGHFMSEELINKIAQLQKLYYEIESQMSKEGMVL